MLDRLMSNYHLSPTKSNSTDKTEYLPMHYMHISALHRKRTGLLLLPKDQFAPHLGEEQEY